MRPIGKLLTTTAVENKLWKQELQQFSPCVSSYVAARGQFVSGAKVLAAVPDLKLEGKQLSTKLKYRVLEECFYRIENVFYFIPA